MPSLFTVHAADVQTEYGLGDENVDAERRMKQSDRQIYGDNDAEVNGIDSAL